MHRMMCACINCVLSEFLSSLFLLYDEFSLMLYYDLGWEDSAEPVNRHQPESACRTCRALASYSESR